MELENLLQDMGLVDAFSNVVPIQIEPNPCQESCRDGCSGGCSGSCKPGSTYSTA
jgi:hypothetical protein